MYWIFNSYGSNARMARYTDDAVRYPWAYGVELSLSIPIVNFLVWLAQNRISKVEKFQ
ncbi:hypothetical protein [Chryseobacterium aurantiacum]|uniref:hypothetical protein n=1 Tax=Chryseobacterium aurantiacum TaxID=2116499 RepID=UPI0013C485BC|nr:hypothetical protein [Chryseobacterium aurantiacum]